MNGSPNIIDASGYYSDLHTTTTLDTIYDNVSVEWGDNIIIISMEDKPEEDTIDEQ